MEEQELSESCRELDRLVGSVLSASMLQWFAIPTIRGLFLKILRDDAGRSDRQFELELVEDSRHPLGCY
jgi:hypothetical protein